MDHFHGVELAIILYEHICDDNNNLMILDKTYRLHTNNNELQTNLIHLTSYTIYP